MKYRWQRGVVEAWQFLGDRESAGVILGNTGLGNVTYYPGQKRLVVHAWSCDKVAEAGDWIIRDPRWGIYPVKDSIFQQTYEACDD